MNASGSDLKKKHNDKKGKGGRKKLLTLLGAILLLGAGALTIYLSGLYVPPVEESAPSTSKRLIEYERADLVEATITSETGSITVYKDGDTYKLKGYDNFPVNQTKMGGIFGACTSLMASNTIEENVTDPVRLAEYGLDSPSVTVVCQYADGASNTILLGDKPPTGIGGYLMLEGDPNVYTVYSSTVTAFAHTAQSLHVVEYTAPSAEAVPRYIMIERKGKATIEMVEVQNYTSAEFETASLRMKQPIDYSCHSERLTALIQNLAGITLSGFEAQAEDLAEYGLDEPEARLVFEDEQGIRMDVVVGKTKDDTLTYVRKDDTNDVYTVETSKLAFLKTLTTEQLLDRFANIINIIGVDSIKIEAPDTTYEMAITRTEVYDEEGNLKTNSAGKAETEDAYFFDGEYAVDTVFKKLYQEIIGLQFDGIISDPESITGEAEVTVTYNLNQEPGTLVIEYIPYDRDNYAIRRQGTVQFYILRDRVEAALSSCAAMKEGTYEPE